MLRMSENISLLLVLFAGTNACPSGWIQDVDFCYFFSDANGTWAVASSYCKTFGTKLAEPSDPGSIKFLAGEVQGKPASRYYLGGTDFFVENQWIWASNMERVTDSAWEPGEPNNNVGIEDCMSLNKDGLWNDVPCTIKLPFICQTTTGGENIIG